MCEMEYEEIFRSAVDGLKAEGRYRVFFDIERCAGRFPKALWHLPDRPGLTEKITVWCSNDYLGMAQHPDVLVDRI
jgi:5-aminolevulinate synthase